MQKTAIYPGTFDPATLGHMDVIHRARHVFDRLIVAVVARPRKNAWFTLDERIDLLRKSLRGSRGIEVVAFDGFWSISRASGGWADTDPGDSALSRTSSMNSRWR